MDNRELVKNIEEIPINDLHEAQKICKEHLQESLLRDETMDATVATMYLSLINAELSRRRLVVYDRKMEEE